MRSSALVTGTTTRSSSIAALMRSRPTHPSPPTTLLASGQQRSLRSSFFDSPELRQALLPILMAEGPSVFHDWVFIWRELEDERRRLIYNPVTALKNPPRIRGFGRPAIAAPTPAGQLVVADIVRERCLSAQDASGGRLRSSSGLGLKISKRVYRRISRSEPQFSILLVLRSGRMAALELLYACAQILEAMTIPSRRHGHVRGNRACVDPTHPGAGPKPPKIRLVLTLSLCSKPMAQLERKLM